MKKTLLLCFIHGFKGGEETFGHKYAFTQDLRTRLGALLPRLDVQVLVYPKYETRGDLVDCVSRFRDWLQEKVIDIEVAKGTPSPTVDPSVRVVLCGHSMGGIVAAETLIALTSDRVIPISTTAGVNGKPATSDGNHTAAPEENDQTPLNGLMFPYIQAVLSFDTPYLGISPGVVAHGAESHYTTASAAFTQLSALASLWNPAAAMEASDGSLHNGDRNNDRSKSATPTPQTQAQPQAASSSSLSSWGSWGKMALYAGAGAALAGGAAAAYLKRDQLTEGFTWVSSHLEFVGCLARGEELRRRVAYMARAHKELGVGFGNLYTRLGKGAVAAKQQQVTGLGGTNLVGTVMGSQRTFCNLPASTRRGVQGGGGAAGNGGGNGGPPERATGLWQEAINDEASDETHAHMSMFEPKENPGYDKLTDDAAKTIAEWTKNDWYESSTEAEIDEKSESPLV
ncbi:hypothetical protein BD289DRAFT_459217 [Coniella lustricola]|uniref:DUF676 domain-containing protein n=1 Tax=Coniella lustricola TaxID=2025994 RepID=A0A2T3AFL7_9PEZI|nr:hypothetical protein BD289DRAFT_459217 [Coniella lustricola]